MLRTLTPIGALIAAIACARPTPPAPPTTTPTSPPTTQGEPLRCDRPDAATWYVRTDGGTPEQCTGRTDAPYPGSGTGLDCALDHVFWLLPPGGSPRIAGGDTILVGPGSHRMGVGASGADQTDACSPEWPWGCVAAPLPSGPDAEHPTCLLGRGFDSGCDAPPELYGTDRTDAVLSLHDTQHAAVACLEITDHEPCVTFHSGGLACHRDAPPYGDWAANGIVAADSSDVVLADLDIHGLAERGLLAGRLQDWTLQRVKIVANGWAGFDGDIEGDDANQGTIAFVGSEISWNGCGETWPERAPTGCWSQSAGGYGDGLGTGSTGGDWLFLDTAFRFNTSDGLDLLYHDQGGSIVVDRVRAEGNAGNQIKTFGHARIVNSLIVGTCGAHQGQPWTFDVDACRAAGNALSITLGDAETVEVVQSTIYSEGDCALLVDETCPARATLLTRNDVIVGGPDYLQPDERTCMLYSECGSLVLDQEATSVHGTKNDDDCPWGPDDLCTDPLLAPSFEPGPGSPAIDSGRDVGGPIPDTDLLGRPRPAGAGVDRGAFEVQ